MAQFQFTIIDYTTNPAGDSTVIAEPVGWDGLVLKLKRHPEWHGFFDYFDNSISTLQFDGEGFAILQQGWEAIGVDAHLELQIEFACAETDAFENLYTGRFDFNTFKQVCGDRCYVEINIETTSCLVQFKNRFDQAVNLESLRTFDLPDGDADDLAPYTGLGFEILMEPQEIEWVFDAEMKTYPKVYNYTDGTTAISALSYGHFYVFGMDKENDKTFIAINNYDLIVEGQNYVFTDLADIYPGLVLFDIPTTLTCIGDFTIDIDVEGEFDESTPDTRNFTGTFVLGVMRAGTTTLTALSTLTGLGGAGLVNNHHEDISWHDSVTVTLNAGDKIFLYLAFLGYQYTTPGAGNPATPYTLDLSFTEFHFRIQGLSLCDATPAKVFLINEAASRTAEIITGNCLLVYSDYFGRTDSEPYTAASDGCGSLELITNGLCIRGATKTDYSEPEYLVTMKEIWEGLNAIHNIGMGAEDDPNRPGEQWLRIEKFQYFYDTAVLVTLQGIANLTKEANTARLFSTYMGGYQKFETETTGGRNDIHTHRNFRTTLNSITNVLQQVCPFIASGHSIETTRWRFGNTTQDWRYDTDTFIISVVRNEEAESGYSVERGDDMPTADNLPGWATCYNVLISPQRNARRWVPIIFECYVDFENSVMRFMDGDGNLIASTFIPATDVDCIVQDDTVPWANMPENADIYLDTAKPYPFDAGNVADFYPIKKPELVRFEYPLSYEGWKTIKANPRGLVQYQCGQNVLEAGWIEEINYRISEGIAEFVLIPQQPAKIENQYGGG